MKWNAYVSDLSIEIEIELTAQIESSYHGELLSFFFGIRMVKLLKMIEILESRGFESHQKIFAKIAIIFFFRFHFWNSQSRS
jgi:hypothetical protein